MTSNTRTRAVDHKLKALEIIASKIEIRKAKVEGRSWLNILLP
jgi:hypothetical protein